MPTPTLASRQRELWPAPEANQPGHRPEVDQDKPTGHPPRSPRRSCELDALRLPLRADHAALRTCGHRPPRRRSPMPTTTRSAIRSGIWARRSRDARPSALQESWRRLAARGGAVRPTSPSPPAAVAFATCRQHVTRSARRSRASAGHRPVRSEGPGRSRRASRRRDERSWSALDEYGLDAAVRAGRPGRSAEHYSGPFARDARRGPLTVSLGSGRRRGLCLGLVRAGAAGSGWSRRSRPRPGRATSRSSPGARARTDVGHGRERVDGGGSIDGRVERAQLLQPADDPPGALDVAALTLGQHDGEIGLGCRAGDEGVDDVPAVLEDRPARSALTSRPPRPGRSTRRRRAMARCRPRGRSDRSVGPPAPASSRCCRTPSGPTRPPASAMSRTLVRV